MPLVAIGLVTAIPALLALIYIGSSTVYEDVVSPSTSGLYASYFIPCSLLLWRRATGQIGSRGRGDDDVAYVPADAYRATGAPRGGSSSNKDGDDEDVVQPDLVWGPWRVPGALGVTNNAFACVYILFVLFWSFWPPETPATPENMNYSVLMTGAVIAFSIVYYHVRGKASYKAPLIEWEVRGVATQKLEMK